MGYTKAGAAGLGHSHDALMLQTAAAGLWVRGAAVGHFATPQRQLGLFCKRRQQPAALDCHALPAAAPPCLTEGSWSRRAHILGDIFDQAGHNCAPSKMAASLKQSCEWLSEGLLRARYLSSK